MHPAALRVLASASLVCLFLGGCGDDTGNPLTAPTLDQLMGSWRVTLVQTNARASISGMDMPMDSQSVMQFTSSLITGWARQGQGTEACYCPGGSVPYSVSGNRLVIDPAFLGELSGMGDYTIDITYATQGSQLTLSVHMVMTESDSLTGEVITSTVDGTMRYAAYTGEVPLPQCTLCQVAVPYGAGKASAAAGIVGYWVPQGSEFRGSAVSSQTQVVSDSSQFVRFAADSATLYTLDTASNCQSVLTSDYQLSGAVLTGAIFNYADTNLSGASVHVSTSVYGDAASLSLTRTTTVAGGDSSDLENSTITEQYSMVPYNGALLPPAWWPQQQCLGLLKRQAAAPAQGQSQAVQVLQRVLGM